MLSQLQRCATPSCDHDGAMQVPCPRCQRAVPITGDQVPPSAPFCSQRCRHGDLAAWADGTFVVPGRRLDDGQGLQQRDEELFS